MPVRRLLTITLAIVLIAIVIRWTSDSSMRPEVEFVSPGIFTESAQANYQLELVEWMDDYDQDGYPDLAVVQGRSAGAFMRKASKLWSGSSYRTQQFVLSGRTGERLSAHAQSLSDATWSTRVWRSQPELEILALTLSDGWMVIDAEFGKRTLDVDWELNSMHAWVAPPSDEPFVWMATGEEVRVFEAGSGELGHETVHLPFTHFPLHLFEIKDGDEAQYRILSSRMADQGDGISQPVLQLEHCSWPEFADHIVQEFKLPEDRYYSEPHVAAMRDRDGDGIYEYLVHCWTERSGAWLAWCDSVTGEFEEVTELDHWLLFDVGKVPHDELPYNQALIQVGFDLTEKRHAVVCRSFEDGSIIWQHDLSQFPALGHRPDFEARQFADVNLDGVAEVAMTISSSDATLRLNGVGTKVHLLLDGATGASFQ